MYNSVANSACNKTRNNNVVILRINGVHQVQNMVAMLFWKYVWVLLLLFPLFQLC